MLNNLSNENIERVDKFGEKLRDRLQEIGHSALWGEEFEVSKPALSDYYRVKVMVNGKPIEKNWLQLNGHTYHHPNYASQGIPWKLHSRFSSNPASPLPWEKKEPYAKTNNNHEMSPGGKDVLSISYPTLYEALSEDGEEKVMDQILEDLHVSWAYNNGRGSSQNPDNLREQTNRTDVTLSVDATRYSEFRQIIAQQYRPRGKHPKRPSYAKLHNDAIDAAITLYIDLWKGPLQDKDQASE